MGAHVKLIGEGYADLPDFPWLPDAKLRAELWKGKLGTNRIADFIMSAPLWEAWSYMIGEAKWSKRPRADVVTDALDQLTKTGRGFVNWLAQRDGFSREWALHYILALQASTVARLGFGLNPYRVRGDGGRDYLQIKSGKDYDWYYIQVPEQAPQRVEVRIGFEVSL